MLQLNKWVGLLLFVGGLVGLIANGISGTLDASALGITFANIALGLVFWIVFGHLLRLDDKQKS